MSGKLEILKARYILLLRLVSVAFISSSGFFLLIVLMLHVTPAVLPFGSSQLDAFPLAGFMPLLGVLLIVAGLMIPRAILSRMNYSSSSCEEGEKRLKRYLFSVTVSYMVIQMSVVPGIAWFLITGAIDWTALLAAASVIVYVREFPRKETVDRLANSG